jgi:hypothetical protein
MKTLAVVLGLGITCALAPSAHASIAISYSLNGGAEVTCASNPVSSTPISCPGLAVGGLTILNVSATSNSPGTPSLSQQFNANLLIQNTTGATQTLDLYFSAQDFLFPTTPPPAEYLTSLSVTTTTGTGTATLQSCLDAAPGGNVLAVSAATFTTACTGGNSISQTNPLINYGPGANSNDVITSVASLGVPFSMSQRVTLVLGSASNINVITSAALTPVPEPASVMFLGTALIGVGTLLRKRVRRS